MRHIERLILPVVSAAFLAACQQTPFPTEPIRTPGGLGKIPPLYVTPPDTPVAVDEGWGFPTSTTPLLVSESTLSPQEVVTEIQVMGAYASLPEGLSTENEYFFEELDYGSDGRDILRIQSRTPPGGLTFFDPYAVPYVTEYVPLYVPVPVYVADYGYDGSYYSPGFYVQPAFSYGYAGFGGGGYGYRSPYRTWQLPGRAGYGRRPGYGGPGYRGDGSLRFQGSAGGPVIVYSDPSEPRQLPAPAWGQAGGPRNSFNGGAPPINVVRGGGYRMVVPARGVQTSTPSIPMPPGTVAPMTGGVQPFVPPAVSGATRFTAPGAQAPRSGGAIIVSGTSPSARPTPQFQTPRYGGGAPSPSPRPLPTLVAPTPAGGQVAGPTFSQPQGYLPPAPALGVSPAGGGTVMPPRPNMGGKLPTPPGR